MKIKSLLFVVKKFVKRLNTTRKEVRLILYQILTALLLNQRFHMTTLIFYIVNDGATLSFRSGSILHWRNKTSLMIVGDHFITSTDWFWCQAMSNDWESSSICQAHIHGFIYLSRSQWLSYDAVDWGVAQIVGKYTQGPCDALMRRRVSDDSWKSVEFHWAPCIIIPLRICDGKRLCWNTSLWPNKKSKNKIDIESKNTTLKESISRGYQFFFFVRKGHKYFFLFCIIYTP